LKWGGRAVNSRCAATPLRIFIGQAVVFTLDISAWVHHFFKATANFRAEFVSRFVYFNRIAAVAFQLTQNGKQAL
jgi:hypothetical protein